MEGITPSHKRTVCPGASVIKLFVAKDDYKWRTEETQEMRVHKNYLIYNSGHACPTPISSYES